MYASTWFGNRESFTHSCGKTRKGHFTVLRQTMRQRWQAKLRARKVELGQRMHRPIQEQGMSCWVNFPDYGVPMNGPALGAFRLGHDPLYTSPGTRGHRGLHPGTNHSR
jgi:hypothetical protein